MAGGFSSDLLLNVDHVKYRKAGEGRSPIGRVFIYSDHVEWRDNTSPELLFIKFGQIKGQRVSPPNKPKVQLQICMHNDDQATFVFLDPGKSREQLAEQRDLLKETLQQALINDRARVNKMAAASEDNSKNAELEQKKMLLTQNQQLQQLYHHLVASKLLTPTDFWSEHFNAGSKSVDSTGVNGAFLSTIATQEGINGVKLNLNAEIIQAIFNMYPAVERKHLELVPHEMNEQTFWSKFFQSHYYHRNRDVLPNPQDPFSDCVRIDDAEIEKILTEGVNRKRLDLDHLDDNVLSEFTGQKKSDSRGTQTRLVKRCNYLSERILNTLRTTGARTENSTSTSSVDSDKQKGKPQASFNVLNRIIDEDETRLESDELVEPSASVSALPVKFSAASEVIKHEYKPEEANDFKRIVLDFFDNHTEEDILVGDDSWLDEDVTMNGIHGAENGRNGNSNGKSDELVEWELASQALAEVKSIHEAVYELLKHFWTCFPPVTEELESKIERMEQTLKTFEEKQLASAIARFGRPNLQHCIDMIAKAHERYANYNARRKK